MSSSLLQTSIYRLRLQDILTLCVLSLLALGVVMVQSASANVVGTTSWRWTTVGARHVIYVCIALATYFAVGRLNYAWLLQSRGWRTPVVWMLLTAVFACLIVLVPGIGKEINYSRRWLPLGFTQVQPSEVGKWAIVLFMAWWLASRPIDLASFKGFIATLVPVGAICLLVVIEDFGTAALIGLCALLLCIAGRIKWWHLAVVIPPAMAVGCWFILHKQYRRDRMLAFLDPFASPQAEGYHMIQSLMSFATGGIFGTGLGRGVQKLGYLPEDTTDFIFAVICEELGLFGAMLTIALYLGILYVVWQVIRQRKDVFGQLLAFGIGSMIGLQALINIAVATVSVPPKGMSLPLVSFGGSGLVITSAALGLLYSVCRHTPEQEAKAEAQVQADAQMQIVAEEPRRVAA